ncbi:polyprenyl synthetase family protein [Sandarakinorhabdus sp.]|uniref:polyprenyl synthetase family protein n=1 Tax=Sandarakinorhabdus sp. TaxID=1916663 RepID=UPI00333FF47B
MVPAPLILKPALDAIGKAIDQRFDRLLAVPDDSRARLYDAMRHAVIGGGKRMRPLLVVAAGDLFAVPRERSLRAALAIECIHCYSLIHDDLPCMDDDDLRRGKPTVHIAFDEATAVLAGDCLHDLAFEILADAATHDDPHARLELITMLAVQSGPAGMAGGQMMDLVAGEVTYDLAGITRLQQLKTGALIQWCLEAGAILGRADDAQKKSLLGYARDLGLAFQIADDLLDVEGTSAKTGKAVQKDAAAGKATFVSLMGLERARSQADALIGQAIGHLASFGPEADLLRAIARFAVDRDR